MHDVNKSAMRVFLQIAVAGPSAIADQRVQTRKDEPPCVDACTIWANCTAEQLDAMHSLIGAAYSFTVPMTRLMSGDDGYVFRDVIKQDKTDAGVVADGDTHQINAIFRLVCIAPCSSYTFNYADLSLDPTITTNRPGDSKIDAYYCMVALENLACAPVQCQFGRLVSRASYMWGEVVAETRKPSRELYSSDCIVNKYPNRVVHLDPGCGHLGDSPITCKCIGTIVVGALPIQ